MKRIFFITLCMMMLAGMLGVGVQNVSANLPQLIQKNTNKPEHQNSVRLAAPIPSLISPENGYFGYENQPSFDWTDIPDASGYLLQYSTDDIFSSPIEQTLTVSEFTVVDPLSGGEWFWRVKATGDGLEDNDWSEVWSLTIREYTDAFYITIDSGSDKDFRIPTTRIGYNYNVDCDDDGVDEATGVTKDYTCYYPSDDQYTIRISDNSGTGSGFHHIYFNGDWDKNKLLSVDHWGTTQWSSMAHAFQGCAYIEINADDTPDLSLVTDMSHAFSFSHINSDISHWDVSNVENMEAMFYWNYAFNQPLSAWDTSSVTTMKSMFTDALNFNQDLTGWNTSNVTRMSSMFSGADEFNGDISTWDTGNVTNMNSMFYSADSFNRPIGDWDTSNVTEMHSMFYEASAFNQPIGNWDVSSVVNMVNMFSSASQFNQNLNNWDMSNVTNIAGMFSFADSFNGAISGWDTSSVTSMHSLFRDADSFNQDIGGWNTSNVKYLAYAFYYTDAFDQNLGSWDVSSLLDAENMLYSTSLSIPNYEELLIGWNAQNLQPDVDFNAQGNYYCSSEAAAARENMTTNDSWSITDNGVRCGSRFSLQRPLGNWIKNNNSDNVGEVPSGEVYLSYAVKNYGSEDLVLDVFGYYAPVNIDTDSGVGVSTSNLTVAPGEVGYLGISFIVPTIGDFSLHMVFDSNDPLYIPEDEVFDFEIYGTTIDFHLDAPTLLTPMDESETTNGVVTYTWETVDGAEGYGLYVHNNSDDSIIHGQYYDATTNCDGTACSITVNDELEIGRYKWHVAGGAGEFYGDWSTYNTFTVTPVQTQLRSPGVDALVYGGRPTFKWYQDTEATSYMIEFYDATSGSDVLIGEWQKNPPCDPYCWYRIPSDMDLGSNYGDYHWRVSTISNGIQGPWSDMRTFTYTQLDRTVQVSPEDGYTTSDTTPTFEWTEITGATMYLFQVRLSDDTFVGNFLVSDDTYCVDGGTDEVGLCTWDIPDGTLEPGTTYKWHVRAKNGRNFGRWTAYREIIIE